MIAALLCQSRHPSSPRRGCPETHPKRRSLVVLRQVLFWNSGLIPVADLRVVRRHDLDARLVELILDVLMEFGIDRSHLIGLFGIGVDFVGDVKIVQAGLQHERFWCLENMSGRVRRCNQEFMDRFPGRIVTDRHPGVKNQTLFFGYGTEIDEVAAKNHSIGDRDVHILDGTYSGDKERS